MENNKIKNILKLKNMKKNYYLSPLTFFCLIFFSIFNCSAQCLPPVQSERLDGNNIDALFNTNGIHFSKETAQFIAPKGSGKSTLFASSLWMGGRSASMQLHLAAMLYGQKGRDYWAGPISSAGAAAGTYYDRFWKVNKAEIEYHKLHYTDPNYEMPESILNWPAHGRTEYGESANLAPYISISGKSTYTPALGDYPFIRGDQAIFWINNDACNAHTESDGMPLGVEIHAMAYAFTGNGMSPTDSADLANTIFIHYNIINKTTFRYEDFHIGSFTDPDIGYGFDDYVGFDVKRNMFYAYNGHNVDGSGQEEAYGENPPAQGIMLLNRDVSKFMVFNNDNGPTGNPVTTEHYYNYMRGIWRDNTRMRYGGNGHIMNGGNGPECNFMFPGDSDPDNKGTDGVPHEMVFPNERGWTEENVANSPYDRRGVMSIFIGTLNAYGNIDLDIAYPFARTTEGGTWASVEILRERADVIKKLYNQSNAFTYLATVSGKVSDKNQTALTSGTVSLYRVKSSSQYALVATVPVKNDGNYLFTDVSQGNYIIKVKVTDSVNALPTYYGNTELWSEATIVSIADSLFIQNMDITVISIEPLEGSSIISGYVVEENNGKKNISKTSVNNSGNGSKAVKPAEGVDVYIQKNESADIWKTVGKTLTNEEGYFEFQNVPIGTYRVILDVPGLEIANPPTVEITEDGQVIDDIEFEIPNNISDKFKNKIVVYPNPSNGHFTITSEEIIESIDLYDLLGKKVFTDIPKAQNIQVNTNLPKGLYIYRIVLQGNSISSGKIIVQ